MTKLKDIIADTGLQFAILDALLFSGALDKDTLAKSLDVAIATIDIEKYGEIEDGERCLDPNEGDEILSKAMVGFGNVEVTTDQLESIETLEFDGGNEIYMFFEGRTEEKLGVENELDTGGESEIYQVSSFAGIGALKNLKTLNLDGHGFSEKTRDAAPLAKLVNLETIVFLGTVDNGDSVSHVANVS